MNQKYFDEIYYRGTDIWPAFHNKSIFIAGHTGFYGGWLFWFLTKLSDYGINVKVYGGSRSNGFNILAPRIDRYYDYVINCAGSPEKIDGRVLELGPTF